MGVVTIDARDKTPIYAQLERGLRAAIAAGRLSAGDQLPTVRQLAVELRINANTVARVYAELERAGVHRDAPRRRLVRRGDRRSGRDRRASTNAACARSSPACWPMPTPPASASTKWSAGLTHRTRETRDAFQSDRNAGGNAWMSRCRG